MITHNINRFMALGDSWVVLEEDTKLERGWPYFMGIPVARTNGICGSTAEEWATDKNGRLTNAITQLQPGDVCIVSLIGNDIRHAASDGTVSIAELSTALKSVRQVAARLCATGATVVFLLYADPYDGLNPQSRIAIPLVGVALKAACLGLPVEFFDTRTCLTFEHFNGVGFHPTRDGHEAIATGLLSTYCPAEQP